MEKKNIQDYSDEEWQSCIKVLRTLTKDPESSPDTQLIKGLITKIYKKAKKDKRKIKENQDREFDSNLLESTIIANLPENKLPNKTDSDFIEKKIVSENNLLKRPVTCYICKGQYNQVHFFYQQLCPNCADFNFLKRSQRIDLSGRTALITGGRIKIGYQVALKLLRDGASVILTTRFPNDATQRFSQEEDFSVWENKLKIFGLELRNLPLVESFISYLLKTENSLDIIINNAAQTVKRPYEFYKHLIDKEALYVNEKKLMLTDNNYDYQVSKYLQEVDSKKSKLINSNFFPVDNYDSFLQQVDMRPENSWVLTLDKVDTVELLETHLVNAFSPFIINSKLKPLLLKSDFEKKFIINVSAMEGQFNRKNKTEFHPHTNMAKAALNMMTRTSGQQYAEDHIFMNSVDTGWITQENPYHKMINLRAKGFVPPLDIIDGAARIYDPIVSGLNSENPEYGKFLKDYREYSW